MTQNAISMHHYKDNQTHVDVAVSLDDLMHVFSIRAICLMEEHGLSAQVAQDGNDFQATHVIAKSAGEPVGCSRLRWFSDFVQIDRTCIRKSYRSSRILGRMVDFTFDHIARKGFSTVITHAAPVYARLWERRYGFKRAEGRPTIAYDGYVDELVELTRDVQPSPQRISRASAPEVFHRIEGRWDDHQNRGRA